MVFGQADHGNWKLGKISDWISRFTSGSDKMAFVTVRSFDCSIQLLSECLLANLYFLSQALNQSSQTEGTRLKEIAPATYAVCFLGTPHRGSNTASIGKVAYQIKVVATKRPNLKLLQALEKNSETLDRVGDAFR